MGPSCAKAPADRHSTNPLKAIIYFSMLSIEVGQAFLLVVNSQLPQAHNFDKFLTPIGVVHVFVEVFKEFLQILILRDVVNFFQFFPKPSISLATVKEATSCIKFLAPSAIPCDAISSGRKNRAYKPAADTGDTHRTAHGSEAHKPRKPHSQAPGNRRKGTRSNQTKASPSTNQTATFSFHRSSSRLLKNVHLRRFPHPSSLQRTSKYASLLRVSEA